MRLVEAAEVFVAQGLVEIEIQHLGAQRRIEGADGDVFGCQCGHGRGSCVTAEVRPVESPKYTPGDLELERMLSCLLKANLS
jgi:hypothetical protein